MSGGEERVVLYDSNDGGERVTVECRVVPGGMAVERLCDGELARFCYDESPHVDGLMVPEGELAPLLDRFGVEGARQLAEVLRVRCAGEDALEHVRDLLAEAGVSHVPMTGSAA